MGKEIITENDIKNKIKKGLYKEDGTVIRDNKNGQIVKILKNNYCDSIIPTTLIQINNNIIYEADINKIINTILEIKNNETFDNLEEKYGILLDSLEYYQTHNDRLNELNKNSLEFSKIFQSKIEKYFDEIKSNDFISDSNNNKILNSTDLYINILFIYLLSTFWLHKENQVSKDNIIVRKIEQLEKKIQNLFEQILTSSHINHENKNIINLNDSLYAFYLLDNNYDIYEIEKFLKYDRRFKSIISLYAFVKKHHIQNTYDDNNYNNEIKYININISNNQINNKKNLASSLYKLLEKIQLLKNVRQEIIESGIIDDNIDILRLNP